MPYKFCVSYSGGKDSALSLYRLIQAGNEPVAIITTVNSDLSRSWFHGIDTGVLSKVSDSLGIPLIKAVSEADGRDYEAVFTEALTRAAELGATHCAFGDIDIEGHLDWNRTVCAKAGLEAVLPLWQEDRAAVVREFIEAGFTAIVKAVSKSFNLPASMLGRVMDLELVREITDLGADPCGENGEYHTFVYDGPLFRYPVEFETQGVFENDTSYSLII